MVTSSKACRGTLVLWMTHPCQCQITSPALVNQCHTNCKTGLICKYLTRPATEKLAHALISFRLDFCNSLLYQLPKTQFAQL